MPTVDALHIASREQGKPCKFPWFGSGLLAIFRASNGSANLWKVGREIRSLPPFFGGLGEKH